VSDERADNDSRVRIPLLEGSLARHDENRELEKIPLSRDARVIHSVIISSRAHGSARAFRARFRIEM